MSRIDGFGIALELPAGWEGRTWRGEPDPDEPASHHLPVVHASSFPAVLDNSTFGTAILDGMPSGGIFFALAEYGSSPRRAPFPATSLPQGVRWIDMHAAYVHSGKLNLVALQHFCTLAGRQFCAYVVAAPPPERAAFDDLNRLLAGVDVAPAAVGMA